MKTQFSALLASAAVATLASSLIAPSSAQAFTLSFDANSRSSNDPATGSSALVDFDFAQSGSDVLLNLTLTNTTGQIPAFGDGATQSTLVGFGFDVIGSVTSFTYNSLSSAFTKLYGDSSLNSSVLGQANLSPLTNSPDTPYDAGIRSSGNGNFSGGNPQTGLTAGQTGSVQFILKGTNLIAADVESAFLTGFSNGALSAGTRFQQVSGPGFSGASDKLALGRVINDNNPNPNPKPVPEPATMFGLGLVASGMLMARRRTVVG